MFDRIATMSLNAPVAVAASILGTVLLVSTIALPPAIEGDLMRLIPDEHPAVRALAAHRAEPGGEDTLALTLPAEANIQEVATRVEKLEGVRATYYGVTDQLGLKLAILQLSPQQIEKLAADIHAAIELGNPEPIDLPTVGTNLLPWAIGAASKPDKASDTQTGSQLLFVIPTAPPVEPKFALRLLEDLERAVPEATFIAGPHADIGTAVREVQQDSLRTSMVSLLLVATIVALALRNVAGLLVLLPPLILANLLAISVVSLIFGALNLYTSIGAAVVFGLGIDFGIHLVARFREELGLGLSPPDAVRAAWSTTGPPCLIAALTSAAGFLVFLIAEFEGMRQLGVVLALGVVLSLTMMLLVLPMLLTRIPMTGHAARRQPGTLTRTWPWTMGAVVILSAVLIPFIPSLQFEYDISAIKSEGLAWGELTPQEQGYRQNAFPPVHIRTDDRSALHQHLAGRIERGEFEHVRGVLSIDSILPPDQEQRLAALANVIESANHPLRTHLPPAARASLERLGNLDTAAVQPQDLPAGLAHLLGAEGDRVLLLLKGNMLDLRMAKAMTQELAEFQDTAASGFFVAAALGTVISRDLPRVAGLALLIVLLIIVFDLRRPGHIAIASGALLLGITWAAAALALFGVPINIVNVVAMPMLLGIGIDIVVHLLHRLRSGSSVGETLRTTGVAVCFSTLTTMAAFVSLTAAHHRGLQSIGLVILIGLSAVLLAAVLTITSCWPFASRSGRS